DDVYAAVGKAPTTAHDGFVLAEERTEKTVAKARVPSSGNARAEAAVERVVGVFAPAPDVLDGCEAQGRVVHLPSQRGALAGREVAFRADGTAWLVDHQELFPVHTVRRHFQLVAKTVGQGEIGAHVPCVAEIAVLCRMNSWGV